MSQLGKEEGEETQEDVAGVGCDDVGLGREFASEGVQDRIEARKEESVVASELLHGQQLGDQLHIVEHAITLVVEYHEESIDDASLDEPIGVPFL